MRTRFIHAWSSRRSRPGCTAVLWLAAVLVALPLAGCWDWQVKETGIASLERFESSEAFKAYLAEQVARPGRSYGGGPVEFLGLAPASPDLGVADPAPVADGETEYSTTNLQEEGVDESDVVKNDGTHLYILTGGELRIVQAVPAEEMRVVARLELPGTPAAMYLRGDRLIAVGQGDSYSSTAVSVVDITERSAPGVEATVEVEGRLVTSRMIGSKLHLVVQTTPSLPASRDGLAIRLADVDELIPDVVVAPAGREPRRRNLVEWQDFYRPIDPDGYGVTALVTIDVEDLGASLQSVGVMADADTIYASSQAIYLTDWAWDFAGRMRETTDIYKFDLTGEGPALAAAGSVSGRLLNRFSLGEHEGFLRAATTSRDQAVEARTPTSNNVYVLADEDGELNIVGRLEGIAPGESIFSARFLGDRGFLVTFEKVDPLFTLDLSDPTSPQVVGELKVPGYSDYLHPLGENHLLAIGKDANDVGDFSWYQGVQISVFDVTDFAQPRRVDVEIVGERGTESEALRDPHAFNYFAPAGMLAVPMTIAEGAGPEPWQRGTPSFQGLCLYSISTDTGIEPVGRMAAGWPEDPYGSGNGWTRGVYIGDYVYAVTGSAVRALPLDDLGGTPIELPLE